MFMLGPTWADAAPHSPCRPLVPIDGAFLVMEEFNQIASERPGWSTSLRLCLVRVLQIGVLACSRRAAEPGFTRYGPGPHWCNRAMSLPINRSRGLVYQPQSNRPGLRNRDFPSQIMNAHFVLPECDL